jgi:hypothetical protein
MLFSEPCASLTLRNVDVQLAVSLQSPPTPTWTLDLFTTGLGGTPTQLESKVHVPTLATELATLFLLEAHRTVSSSWACAQAQSTLIVSLRLYP